MKFPEQAPDSFPRALSSRQLLESRLRVAEQGRSFTRVGGIVVPHTEQNKELLSEIFERNRSARVGVRASRSVLVANGDISFIPQKVGSLFNSDEKDDGTVPTPVSAEAKRPPSRERRSSLLLFFRRRNRRGRFWR